MDWHTEFALKLAPRSSQASSPGTQRVSGCSAPLPILVPKVENTDERPQPRKGRLVEIK